MVPGSVLMSKLKQTQIVKNHSKANHFVSSKSYSVASWLTFPALTQEKMKVHSDQLAFGTVLMNFSSIFDWI